MGNWRYGYVNPREALFLELFHGSNLLVWLEERNNRIFNDSTDTPIGVALKAQGKVISWLVFFYYYL